MSKYRFNVYWISCIIGIHLMSNAGLQGKNISTDQCSFFLDTIPVTKTKDTTAKRNVASYFKSVKLRNEPNKVKWMLQFDIRNSFVRNYPIDLYGINTGLKFKNRLRIGVGFYFADNHFNNNPLPVDLKTGKVLLNSKGKPILTNDPHGEAVQHLTLYYGTVNLTYIFYNCKAIELSIPLELGYGHFKENLTLQTTGQSINLARSPAPTVGNFMPFLAGIAILMKVHKWIYLQGSIGYRKSLFEKVFEKNITTSVYSQLDGLYWHAGVQINLNTLLKDYKIHKIKHRKLSLTPECRYPLR